MQQFCQLLGTITPTRGSNGWNSLVLQLALAMAAQRYHTQRDLGTHSQLCFVLYQLLGYRNVKSWGYFEFKVTAPLHVGYRKVSG